MYTYNVCKNMNVRKIKTKHQSGEFVAERREFV